MRHQYRIVQVYKADVREERYRKQLRKSRKTTSVGLLLFLDFDQSLKHNNSCDNVDLYGRNPNWFGLNIFLLDQKLTVLSRTIFSQTFDMIEVRET